MKFKLPILPLLMSLGLISAAKADELLAVQSVEKGGVSSVALDLLAEGKGTAFQVRLDLPKGVSAVDTSKCLSELPKNYQGTCMFNKEKNQVFAIAYNLQNELLPTGMVRIGSLQLRGNIAQTAQIKVSEFLVSDPKGDLLPTKYRVEEMQ